MNLIFSLFHVFRFLNIFNFIRDGCVVQSDLAYRNFVWTHGVSMFDESQAPQTVESRTYQPREPRRTTHFPFHGVYLWNHDAVRSRKSGKGVKRSRFRKGKSDRRRTRSTTGKRARGGAMDREIFQSHYKKCENECSPIKLFSMAYKLRPNLQQSQQ